MKFSGFTYIQSAMIGTHEEVEWWKNFDVQQISRHIVQPTSKAYLTQNAQGYDFKLCQVQNNPRTIRQWV